MGVSFETYLRRRWDVQRDVVTTSPRRLVAGWESTKNNQFTISLQYLMENMKDEVDFLPTDKYVEDFFKLILSF